MSEDVLDLQEAVLDGGIRAVNFFTGRLLTGRDFGREQEARRDGDARLGRALGSGVVQGLEVELAPAALQQPGRPVVRVHAGEALNPCGQALRLKDDAYVALTQQAEPGIGDDAAFKRCTELPVAAGTYVSGAGVYLLTIAPAQSDEGKASTNGLDPFNVRCNSDATVEAVQFRLFLVPPERYAALDRSSKRFRQELAALFFGNAAVDSVLAGAQPPVDPAWGAMGAALAVVDQPLALVYFAANQLQFIDNHAVRRRATRLPVAGDWQLFADDRREAEGEALFLDFQEQLAAIAKPLASAKAVRAADFMSALPAAGILPVGPNAFDWTKFLGSAAPATTYDLDRGLVRSVLRRSFRQEPVALGGSTRFHVYRVLGPGGAAPYVLFARSRYGETLAEDTAFDNSLCNLPGADDVQTAIEEVWKLARCGCSIVIAPGAGWEKAFDRIPDGSDAKVCFQPGDYPLVQPLVVAKKRFLEISGAGAGTRIHADGSERALVFDQCQAVHLSDLSVKAGALGAGGNLAHIGGAVTFTSCGDVVAERLTLECAGDADNTTLKQRAASGLTVANAAGSAAGRVRVRSCRFSVGRQQVGLQLVNVSRAQVEDNELRVKADAGVSWARLDADYRAALLRRMLSPAKLVQAKKAAVPVEKAAAPAAKVAAPAPKAVVPTKKAVAKKATARKTTAKAKPRAAAATKASTSAKTMVKVPAPKPRATAVAAAAASAAAPHAAAAAPVASLVPAADEVAQVTYNGVSVSFVTVPALARATTLAGGAKVNAWQQLIDQTKPTGVSKAADLSAALERAAADLLATGKVTGAKGLAVDKFPGAVKAVFEQELPAGSQGIVVAGQSLDEVRITDNLVDGFVQGIHVAASQRDAVAPTHVLQAGNVIVRDNTVRVALPSSATRERHGIFVGNCTSLVVEGNRLRAEQGNPTAPIRIEGIRVWGAAGRRMLVRANHLSGFTIGVRFWPTNVPRDASAKTFKVLWTIAENLCEGSSTLVQIQPRAGKVPIPANVPSFVKGLESNLA